MLKTKRILLFLLLLMIIAGTMTGCNVKKTKSFQCVEDFEQARIGILTGSSHDNTAKEFFPKASRVYFNNMSDMILAVEQGKIDGYLEDAPFVAPLNWEGIALKCVDGSVGQVSNGFIFPQGESTQLREQINEFIGEAKSDGTIEQLTQKWLGKTEPTEHPDYSTLTGENGTIHLAVSVDGKPMFYQNADGFTGFEMELLTAFAQHYGYKFDIEVVPFESIIAGISANKYDMGASSLNITDERKESVDFSDAYSTFETVIVVKGDSENKAYDTLSDLENATLGIITGTNYDNVAKEKFPNAERMYFSTSADVLLALKQGKVDAYFTDKVVVASMQWENQKVDYIDEPVEMISNALILAKEGYDPYLLAQLNEFIGNSKNNGTLERLEEKWVGDTEPSEHPDYTKLTGENGTLKIAVSDSLKPVSYQKGSMYTGYEVDFLTLFAEEYGYKLEIQGMAFDALIPSIASGKCDIGASGITITPERAESLTFTDPHFETYGVAAIIRGENAAASSAKTLADFESAVIGVMNGSSFDLLASEYYPTAEKRYLNMPDLILNLQQEKINGILMDMGFYTPIIWEGESLSYIEMDMPATEYAVAFPKAAESEALMAQFNEFIRNETENGGLAELEAKWLSASEPDGSIDFTQLTGENGTLHVATTVESKPFSYLKDGKYYGYDADFLFRFAKEYGYALRIDQIDFGALLPGLTAGRFDLAVSGITVTEERRETVLFSDAYYRSPIIMAVLAEGKGANTEPTFADFEQAKIGVLTGSSHDNTAQELFPNAERVYFNNMSDMILAVEQGKIDCYLEDAQFLAPLIWEGVNLNQIDESVGQMSNGFVFPKGESTHLREQINEFLGEAKSDGTIERLTQKWLGKTEPTEHPDYPALTGENGTLRLAISVDNKPMLYQNADGFTGFEMELLTAFGQRYGYKFDIEVVPFESIIAGISANKYDMGASSLNITDERKESVDFSDAYSTFETVIVVKGDSENKAYDTLSDLETQRSALSQGRIMIMLQKKSFPMLKECILVRALMFCLL